MISEFINKDRNNSKYHVNFILHAFIFSNTAWTIHFNKTSILHSSMLYFFIIIMIKL